MLSDMRMRKMREFTVDDLDGIYALYDGQARQYLEPPSADRAREREVLEAYIDRIYGLYGFGHWAVLALDPEKNPQKSPERDPEKNPQKSPEREPEKNQKKDSETNPEKNAKNGVEREPETNPEKDLERDPEQTAPGTFRPLPVRPGTLIGRIGFSAVTSEREAEASALGVGALNVPATKSIPSYEWWSEALHGYSRGQTSGAVIYPQNLTMASTWNPELYYRQAVEIGDEIREKTQKNSETGNAKNLNFYSPTVNMHRDPRWGRNEESFSEDVYLTGKMAAEFALGMEGKDREGNLLDPDGYLKTMCTVKHYVANNSERNRLNGGATTDLRAIREYYVAPYAMVIRAADIRSVMTAYLMFVPPMSIVKYLLIEGLLCIACRLRSLHS